MDERLNVTKNDAGLKARFAATGEVSWPQPRYNAAPSQALPVILNTKPHAIKWLVWGLKPAWVKKTTQKGGIIHVRAETLRERPTFHEDLAKRRCLVLADSFYVWQKTAGRRKIPFRV